MTQAPPRSEAVTLLIVEDDELLRELLVEVFEAAGFLLIVAAEPEAALEAASASSETIPLAVLDVSLPGSTGMDLAKRLRSLRPGMQMVFMSGHSQETVATMGFMDPEDTLVRKPFSCDQLVAEVCKILDSPRGGGRPRMRTVPRAATVGMWSRAS